MTSTFAPRASAASPTGNRRGPRRRGRATGYAFVAPAMLLLTAFGILPLIVAVVVSFTDMNIRGLADWSRIEFVGLQQYAQLFGDDDFWSALLNTGIFVVMGVPAIIVVSLAIAIMLNHSQNRFFRFLRAFYFIPAITAIVAVSLIWGYLYNTQFGLINYGLSLVGIGPVQWLSDPIIAKFSVALVAIWRATGLNIIIFLAALQGIPKEYLEAAALDGAGPWKRITRIQIPLLRFAIFFVTVTTLINWMQFFDEPFVLTDGGPLGATTSISMFLYLEGFRQNQFGYASAGSVVLFVIIVAITVIQLRLRKADDEY